MGLAFLKRPKMSWQWWERCIRRRYVPQGIESPKIIMGDGMGLGFEADTIGINVKVEDIMAGGA